MRASSGSIRFVDLHIGGRPAEGAESEQVGGGSSGLPSASARAPLVGHPPLPIKGKERISKIRHSTRSEYLRATVRCLVVVGPSRVEPSYAEIFATRYRPRPISMFGVKTFSPLTSSMFLIWFSFLRRPLKMVSASLYTISSSVSFGT